MFKPLACAVLAATCSTAMAWTNADHTPERYVGLMGTYVDPDDARLTDRKGYGGRLFFGQEFSPWFAMEASISEEIHRSLPGLGDDNLRLALGLDALLLLGNRHQFAAYGLLGIGASYYDTSSSSRDDEAFNVDLGGGLISQPFSPYFVRLRVEGRYRRDSYGPGVDDYLFSAGVEFPIGRKSDRVGPKYILLPPTKTPLAAEPVEPPKNYPARPIDTDQDGVLDNFDRCLGTPLGALVDESGCQVEFQNEDLSLEGVQFQSASNTLTPNSLRVLDSAAEALIKNSNLTATIAGHTDSQGNEDYNLTLSLARANAVKRHLTQKGVAAKRLKVVGFGESQPIADNATAAGRAKNRRVEFRLDSGFDPK